MTPARAVGEGVPGEGSPVVPVAELGYAEASRELDQIVAYFEEREVDVDLLVARLERATAIVEELDRRLRHTKLQVEELVPRLASLSAAEAGPSASDGEGLDNGGPEVADQG